MTEVRRALAEISAIRIQVARGTQFRGYGPRSVAASGVLALLVAAVQAVWVDGQPTLSGFLAVWLLTALVSVGLSARETVVRARRVHHGLAREMIHAALEQFLPAVVVGILLTMVLVEAAPDSAWMLPGLWALIYSLGVFASCRFLPRPMFAVGLWYLAAGLGCLTAQSTVRTLSPWAMGIAFGVGQLLIAGVLRHGQGELLEEG